jgi:hypothetical protein
MQQDDWSFMSLNKRSDVKNHLSTRASNTVRPVKPGSQPDIPSDSESERHSTKPNVPGSGNSADEPTVKKPRG